MGDDWKVVTPTIYHIPHIPYTPYIPHLTIYHHDDCAGYPHTHIAHTIYFRCGLYTRIEGIGLSTLNLWLIYLLDFGGNYLILVFVNGVGHYLLDHYGLFHFIGLTTIKDLNSLIHGDWY